MRTFLLKIQFTHTHLSGRPSDCLNNSFLAKEMHSIFQHLLAKNFHTLINTQNNRESNRYLYEDIEIICHASRVKQGRETANPKATTRVIAETAAPANGG